MNTIGFPISHKENENRRAVLPSDLHSVKNTDHLIFEQGYGEVIGFSDEEYLLAGASVAPREEVLGQKIICDPKIGDADYLESLSRQTVFGWIHAVQNRNITDCLINGKLTAFAWEDMFDEGRHVFWRNNEIAGEAAIMHAFQLYAKMPYQTKIALIGRGNVASGALRILTLLGADVTIFNRHTEKLLRKELPTFDVIVNAVLWDVNRKDHLVTRDDLRRMKRNSMIIDISCDKNGAIESSVPTTIQAPVYTEDGVLHYVVDHTPSLFYKTASSGISAEVVKYLDALITAEPNEILERAEIVRDGVILDERINVFQKRK